MSFTGDGPRVTLEMSSDDYGAILVLLGVATGVLSQQGDMKGFWAAIGVINRINEGNPSFRPYEIPETFR